MTTGRPRAGMGGAPHGPEVRRIDPVDPEPSLVGRAARLLRRGRLVALPTETVYGLGADALDAGAVARIFAVKGRPAADPLIVHVADPSSLHRVAAEVPDVAWRLAARFWPGPLTLVLLRSNSVPAITAGGRSTVAVRIPAHPVALAVIEASGTPVAAPSANRFGRISPTTAADVVAELGAEVDLVLDAGPTRFGLESTVVDLTDRPPLVLRPGALDLEELREELPDVVFRPHGHDAAPAGPGRYLRHYAPMTPLVLCAGEEDELPVVVATALGHRGLRVVLLTMERAEPTATDAPGIVRVPLGSAEDLGSVARALYRNLRVADEVGADLLVAQAAPERGPGVAVNDRLFRAAQGRVVSDAEPSTVEALAEGGLATAVLPAGSGEAPPVSGAGG